MTNADIVNRAITYFRDYIRSEESQDPPFLKTCPKCNAPIRANDHKISVVLESFNSRDFTNIRYYCTDHKPEASDVTDNLLTGYAVVLTVVIEENSPHSESLDRDINVVDQDVDIPDSYSI